MTASPISTHALSRLRTQAISAAFWRTPHSLTVTGQSTYRTHAWVEVGGGTASESGGVPKRPWCLGEQVARIVRARIVCGLKRPSGRGTWWVDTNADLVKVGGRMNATACLSNPSPLTVGPFVSCAHCWMDGVGFCSWSGNSPSPTPSACSIASARTSVDIPGRYAMLPE